MKIQILMVSRERYFAEVFGNYLSSVRGELSLLSFTDYGKALAWLGEGQGEIRAVLADQAFLDMCGHLQLPKISLSNDTEAIPEGVSRLNIYQRKRDILEDLKALLVSVAGLSQSKRVAGGTRTLGVFSTQGGSGKSTVAYLTALVASEGKKTAYINLESRAFTGGLYTEGVSAGMDELLYAIKDRRALTPVLLNTLVRNHHGVYVLPPYSGIGDRLELQAEDVGFLLDGIESLGDFDLVMLDMDAGLSPFVISVLERCDGICAVYSDTVVGQGKLQNFKNDPSRGILGFEGRLMMVGNMCRQKYADGRYDTMLPFSQSVEKGTDLAVVMGANREFHTAGATILAACGRLEATV